MKCASCDLPSDANTLCCSGTCGSAFHISCLGKNNQQYKNALSTYMSKIPNLRWYCDGCILVHTSTQSLTVDLTNRLNDIKLIADDLLTKLNPSALTSQIGLENSTSSQKSDQTSQHDKSSSDLNGSFATAGSSDQMETDIASDTPYPNVNARPRKRPASPLLAPPPLSKKQNTTEFSPKSLADLLVKPMETKSAESLITVKTNLMRSIYISPFDPSTEPEHIMRHLKSNDDLKHIVPNIKCSKLLRINHHHPLTFVSFKLDVPRHHYDIITAPSIWQIDGKNPFTIKEFDVKFKGGAKPSGSTVNNNNNKSNNKSIAKTKAPAAPSSSNGQRNQRSSKTKNGGSRQPKKNVKPNSNGNFRQGQRKNFQIGCQKQCCSQMRSSCIPCTDHCVGSRCSHRPRNCR